MSALEPAGWVLRNDSRMAVACLAPPPGAGDPETVVAKVLEAGREWISVAVLEGRPVVRVCITNGRTRTADIDALVERLVGLEG